MEPSSSPAADPAVAGVSLVKQQMQQKTSAVRVGVRVRPFTSQEISKSRSSDSILTCITNGTQELRLGSRRFTYDAVFDESVSQETLHQSVAGPLMENFLEGYNATIMAYGQTGSGKTYTMGSEAHDDTEISSQTGIIPRFMRDLFTALEKRKEAYNASAAGPTLQDYTLTASFLEVYGEDVHDLLIPSRPSIPVREDANGGIVCVGLTEFPITTAQDALQVLHEGTMHRTTAATLMNLTSSRSHAVFAVTLTQKTCIPTSGESMTTTTVSRLNFVDLAGSERMKKTGAEGERAREGIKINEGLLALGNVINALADQKRINEGKKMHVPYRQSKLTRLLQDALGGNSQTLFLACVSPSDTNASETLSTLNYANRARNIRNAPVQNVDSSMLELQRLRAWSQILQNELLRHKFCSEEDAGSAGKVNDALLIRGEVQEYLHELQSMALQDNSVGKMPSAAFMMLPLPPVAGSTASPLPLTLKDAVLMDVDAPHNQSIIDNFDSNLLSEVNPDHEMKILDQLLELQQQDQAFDDEQKEGNEKLEKMNGELAEQESMLLELRDSLKVYHNIKNRYEVLMAEVQQLETEKAQLASKLEKASVDPTQGCSSSIKRELDKVEKSLARARNETRKHRDTYRKLEREAQKCQVLDRKIADLKNGKAAMIKKQKEATAKHREYTEKKTRELTALKRRERNADKKVTKLQNEVHIHKRNLEKRQQFIQKLNDKLKQTEMHLMKLLSTRQRNLQDRMSSIHNRHSMSHRMSVLPNSESFHSSSSAEVQSAGLMMNRLVTERVSHFCLNNQYQQRVKDYGEAMKDMVAAVDELRQQRTENSESDSVTDALQAVEDTELRVELISADVDGLRSQIESKENLDGMQQDLTKMLGSQPTSVLRALLVGLFDKQVSSEQRRTECETTMKKNERTVQMLEQEVDLLNQKVASFANENARRQQLANGAEDPFLLVQSLKNEKDALLASLQEKSSKCSQREIELAGLKECLAETSRREKETRERLVTVEAAGDKALHAERALRVLSDIQSVWHEIGHPTETDDDFVRSIENCLEDTCERKFSEVSTKRDELKAAVAIMVVEVQRMQSRLGEPVESPPDFPSLLASQKHWEQIKSTTLPRFQAALARTNEMKKLVSELQSAMTLAVEELPNSLKPLVSAESNPAQTFDLSLENVSQCEDDLTALRVQKSEILVQNTMRQKEAHDTITDMNVPESELSHFVTQVIRKRRNGLPDWWQEETAQTVARALSVELTAPAITKAYTQHLATIHEAVTLVGEGRGFLSEKLQGLIERSQRTLLSTVEGGHDAIEAYGSFHDALFRLPKLSQERIDTCLSQITDLIMGVDAMIQSEIEALTVVWEALSTPTSSRGRFWESVDQVLAMADKEIFPSSSRTLTAGVEDWLTMAAKGGEKNYLALEKRLLKLDAVHKEVETLRSRQDAKSKVLSLDSEVRILNAQLSEFEENTCSKDRLLSRQKAGSNLLREERYRKQMKTKFTSKLEQLSGLLRVWNEHNSEDFDASILSEDVRMLLGNSSWIEQRKEFMHLRTTKTKRTGKRRIERTGSNESDSPSPPPKRAHVAPKSKPTALPSVTKKSRATLAVAPSGKSKTSATSTSKRKATEVKPDAKPLSKKRKTATRESNTLTVNTAKPAPKKPSSAASSRRALSSQQANVPPVLTKTTREKRLTLPPFGHVLEQALTPRNKPQSDENTLG